MFFLFVFVTNTACACRALHAAAAKLGGPPFKGFLVFKGPSKEKSES